MKDSRHNKMMEAIKNMTKKVHPNYNNLHKFRIETVIKWRNSASQRIADYDATIKEFEESIAKLATERNKLLKRRTNDAHWTRHLNHHLYKRVLKYRPKGEKYEK